MNLKQLRQAKADNDAAQAKLKAEGRTLMAVKERPAEQTARLDAIDGELKTLADAAATITTDIARAERYAQDEINSATRIEVGANRAESQPWGPEVRADAPAHIQREAMHIALGNFALAVRERAMSGQTDPRLQA